MDWVGLTPTERSKQMNKEAFRSTSTTADQVTHYYLILLETILPLILGDGSSSSYRTEESSERVSIGC